MPQATTELATDARASTGTARSRRRMRKLWALALPLVILAAACNPIDEVKDIFGLGDNEVATPEFEITNGIKIRVVVKAPSDLSGADVTVHVRCAGGTHASQTVKLGYSDGIALGATTFDQGWPLGLDCVVSQEIVQGVEVVQAILTMFRDGETLQATFTNA